MTAQPATASLMRSINRSAVLDLLRQESPLARTEIARRLNLSLPTVMRIVEELLAEELVRPLGHAASRRGRPRAMLEFSGESHAVIGIDLGGVDWIGAIANLTGAVQHEIKLPGNGQEAEANLERLLGLIEALLAVPLEEGQTLRGIGVGVPGLTHTHEGIVAYAPSLGWRDLPLREILCSRFTAPVFIENDVNLAALGEWGFGAGRGAQSLVCISVGTGMGAGIIQDGGIQRGFRRAAGEIGYLVPDPEHLGQPYASFGHLESLTASAGIAARATQARAAEGGGAHNGHALTSDEVFEAARAGENWAQTTVAETADYLSLAVLNVATLLDPELIVLGGSAARWADDLIEPIRRRLDQVTLYMPRLEASPLERRAAVMGAIMLVLNGTTEAVVARRLT
jgi:predicted NBD/HSP70 family sugar kinase